MRHRDRAVPDVDQTFKKVRGRLLTGSSGLSNVDANPGRCTLFRGGVMNSLSNQTESTLNGLALEYKRDYGTARGHLDIFNLVNNPAANGVCNVLGLSFEEQLGNRFFVEFRALLNDRTNPPMLNMDRL